MPVKDTFVGLLNFGFDKTGSQYDIRIDVQFGPRHLQGLISERRSEMVYLLRLYANQIESGWLSKEGGTPQKNIVENQDNTQQTNEAFD